MGPARPTSRWIDRTPPRALFAELVGEAASETEPAPSELAQAYLVDLLAGRIRAPGPSDAEPSLAESWQRAQQAEGTHRIRHLRGLGDRALFVSGFFGESLLRGVVGPGYYRDMGRRAYGSLAAALERWRANSDQDAFNVLANRAAIETLIAHLEGQP